MLTALFIFCVIRAIMFKPKMGIVTKDIMEFREGFWCDPESDGYYEKVGEEQVLEQTNSNRFKGVAIILFVVIIILIFKLVPNNNCDEKISYYENENAKIEATLEQNIKDYQDYETAMLIEDDSQINEFLEIKYEELVGNPTEAYSENKKKIDSLEKNKPWIPVYKFLLYFNW